MTKVIRCDVDQILPLRAKVLRAGKPVEMAQFEHDRLSTTRHYALLEGELAKGCLTLIQNGLEIDRYVMDVLLAEAGPLLAAARYGLGDVIPAWQLRGMATDDGSQGRGFGSQLIRFAVEEALVEGFSQIYWCNAREKAVPFYERNGWKVISKEFDVPGIGSHFKMILLA